MIPATLVDHAHYGRHCSVKAQPLGYSVPYQLPKLLHTERRVLS